MNCAYIWFHYEILMNKYSTVQAVNQENKLKNNILSCSLHEHQSYAIICLNINWCNCGILKNSLISNKQN